MGVHNRMGYLYKQKGRDGRPGRIWWIKYYVNGRPVRESTGTEKGSEAKRILKERLGRVATGQPILPRADRVRYEEVVQDLRQHYETTGRRDLEEADYRLQNLKSFFAGKRIVSIGPADVTAYVGRRQAEGAANGTINRELATLRRMLRLAYENGKLLRLPIIRLLKEGEPRQGFFEREQFEAVRRHLPDHLKPVVTFAYITGWRMRSEILCLQWRQVDFKAGTVRLEPGTTKTGEGRTFYMASELRACLEGQKALTEALQRQNGRIIPWVFHRKGRPIGEFRKAWKTACQKAGVPGRIPHDFRRTAVRNLERAEVPRSVAMKMVGHRTESIYRRYAIVDEAMLRDGAEKLARGGEAATGITAGITGRSALDGRRVSV